MTDSPCTRSGEGRVPARYHAPMWTPPVSSPDHVSQTGNFPDSGNMADQSPTQHPEQSAKPLDVTSAVNIPLPLQRRILEAYLLDDARARMHRFIDENWDEITDLSFQRLEDGFRTFHSAMYGWGPDRRAREATEEAADLNLYLGSGEVE